jgi:uncharacterized protein YdaU (DUF1376 family)
MAALDDLDAPRQYVDLASALVGDSDDSDEFFAVEHPSHLPNAPQRPCASALPVNLWQTPDHSHFPPLLPFEELLALHSAADGSEAAAPRLENEARDSGYVAHNEFGLGSPLLRSPQIQATLSPSGSDAENTMELLRTPASRLPPIVLDDALPDFVIALAEEPAGVAEPAAAAGEHDGTVPARRALPPPRRVTAVAPRNALAVPLLPSEGEAYLQSPPRSVDASVTMRTPLRIASAGKQRRTNVGQMNDADFESLIRQNNKRLQEERIATVRARANAQPRSRAQPPVRLRDVTSQAPSMAGKTPSREQSEKKPSFSMAEDKSSVAADGSAPAELAALLSGHNQRMAANRKKKLVIQQEHTNRDEQLPSETAASVAVAASTAVRGEESGNVHEISWEDETQRWKREWASIPKSDKMPSRSIVAADRENVNPVRPAKKLDEPGRKVREGGLRRARVAPADAKPRVSASVQFTSANGISKRPRARLEQSINQRRAKSALTRVVYPDSVRTGDSSQTEPDSQKAASTAVLADEQSARADKTSDTAREAVRRAVGGGRANSGWSTPATYGFVATGDENQQRDRRPPPLTKAQRDRAAKKASTLDKQERDLAALLSKHNSTITAQRQTNAALTEQR